MGSTQPVSQGDRSSSILIKPDTSETIASIVHECIIENSDGTLSKLRRIRVPVHVLDNDVTFVKHILDNVEKLSKCNVPTLTRYDKVWFEGLQSEIFTRKVYLVNEENVVLTQPSDCEGSNIDNDLIKNDIVNINKTPDPEPNSPSSSNYESKGPCEELMSLSNKETDSISNAELSSPSCNETKVSDAVSSSPSDNGTRVPDGNLSSNFPMETSDPKLSTSESETKTPDPSPPSDNETRPLLDSSTPSENETKLHDAGSSAPANNEVKAPDQTIAVVSNSNNEIESANSGSSTTSTDTFLCILSEHYDYITLEDWLKDRDGEVLLQTQIVHIFLQLLLAVKPYSQNGILLTKSRSLLKRDIHVVQNSESSAYENFSLRIKLTNVDVESLLDSFQGVDTNPKEVSQNLLDCLAEIFLQILHGNIGPGGSTNSEQTVEAKYPQEWEIVQEMKEAAAHTNPSVDGILQKLEKLYEIHSKFVMLPPPTARKDFVGRDMEIDLLLGGMLTEKPGNNVIVLEGAPGIGKSELANKLSERIGSATQQSQNINLEGAILYVNASSLDNLTHSVYNMACQVPFQISLKDYANNVRKLHEIVRDQLQAFGGKKLLLVFDNAHPFVELNDLLQVFAENVKSNEQSENHFALIITTKSWKVENLQCGSISISLPKLSPADAVKSLRDSIIISSCNDDQLHDLAKITDYTPASLRIMAAYINDVDSVNCDSPDAPDNNILQSIVQFAEQHLAIIKNSQNSSISLIYTFSIFRLYESLNEKEKVTLIHVMNILELIDGERGLNVEVIIELTESSQQVELGQTTNSTLKEETSSILRRLHRLSLIKIKDNIAHLSPSMQKYLQESRTLLVETFQCGVPDKPQNLLSDLEKRFSRKKKLIPHVTKIWGILARKDLNLAKQFSHMPEAFAKYMKDSNKLEEVIGFLKDAIEILTLAYMSPHDIQVLKLKYLLAEGSLLPQSKVNEAFTILKSVNDHCRTEPREFLMLKLKTLIELGQIHISRQEYEKAISCFQHVQIFAVQKISLLELDSELTVLKSRVFHGYAHLLQNNLIEAKKILLQVIPLLQRYTGGEISQARLLITQAKFYLATILRKNGDLVNALMMQTKIVEERDRILGPKHPDTWASKQEMAMLLSSFENQDKALALLREVLEIQESVLGAPSNRHSLVTMSAIAEVEAKLGNFDEALELYEAIDLIEQQVLSDNDEMRLSTQLKQAEVHISLGQYKEGIDILDLVFALLTTTNSYIAGESSSSVQTTLSEIIAKRERVERSMEIMGNYWLELTPENIDDPSALSTLAKKHEVAMELSENQDNHGALRFLREVIEDGAHLDETNKFHLNVQADLARVLGLVGKFNESFSVYKEIIPLMEATFGDTDELTMLCKDTMGQVFLFSGNQFLKRQMSNLKWFLF